VQQPLDIWSKLNSSRIMAALKSVYPGKDFTVRVPIKVAAVLSEPFVMHNPSNNANKRGMGGVNQTRGYQNMKYEKFVNTFRAPLLGWLMGLLWGGHPQNLCGSVWESCQGHENSLLILISGITHLKQQKKYSHVNDLRHSDSLVTVLALLALLACEATASTS
jgi:hypothetical protein